MKCDAFKGFEHGLRPQGALKKRQQKNNGGKHLTRLLSYRKMGIYLVIKTWISSLALMDFASIFHDFVQSCAFVCSCCNVLISKV